MAEPTDPSVTKPAPAWVSILGGVALVVSVLGGILLLFFGLMALSTALDPPGQPSGDPHGYAVIFGRLFFLLVAPFELLFVVVAVSCLRRVRRGLPRADPKAPFAYDRT